MKNKTITTKIFIIFVSFIISIFVLIGMFTMLLLPKYYVNKKIKTMDKYKTYIAEVYNKKEYSKVYNLFDELVDEIGGEYFVYDEFGQTRGNGKYRQNNLNNHINLQQGLFETKYVNRYDMEMYVMTVSIENEYIVYEVSIKKIGDVVETMIEFLIILLVIFLSIASIVAYRISVYITRPIKEINKLAKNMKQKTTQSIIVYDAKDEIGELNNSINILYDELLANINQLEKELKKERSVEKLKKQFLAQATHELKTPLAVIGGYAELVKDGIYKNEEERDYFINNIYNETENMNKLIIELLDYSKIETGFFSINKEDVFVNKWFNNIVDIFRGISEELKVNNLIGDLCISMDPLRMEQVIKNLISNAKEHTTGEIILNAYNENGDLKIEVINEGKNIDDRDLPYIFDSFYKTKGKKTGTGLGLAIVKGIVDAHNGECLVKNIETGVKFIIIIPK